MIIFRSFPLIACNFRFSPHTSCAAFPAEASQTEGSFSDIVPYFSAKMHHENQQNRYPFWLRYSYALMPVIFLNVRAKCPGSQ